MTLAVWALWYRLPGDLIETRSPALPALPCGMSHWRTGSHGRYGAALVVVAFSV